MGIGHDRVNLQRIRLLVSLIQWHLYPFTFKEPPLLLVIRAALIIILAFKQNWPEFY